MSKKGIGVYWGRFNPPHEGHLRVIRRFVTDWELIVAIGSAERHDTRTDPFSGLERKRMMEAFLRERGVEGVRVVTLLDGPSESWALDQLLRRYRPKVLFLSTEKESLAALAEPRVRVLGFRRTGSLSSTRIRDAIARGDPSWRALTGASVARLIDEWDGIRRIRHAYGRARTTSQRRRASGVPRTMRREVAGTGSGPGRI